MLLNIDVRSLAQIFISESMAPFEYLVIPFKPTVSKKATYGDIANQVHQIISSYSAKGWEFYRIDKVESDVKGLGADPLTIQVMIFRKPWDE